MARQTVTGHFRKVEGKRKWIPKHTRKRRVLKNKRVKKDRKKTKFNPRRFKRDSFGRIAGLA